MNPLGGWLGWVLAGWIIAWLAAAIVTIACIVNGARTRGLTHVMPPRRET